MTGRTLEAWFIEDVLPLEPMLTRFLQRNWRNSSEIPDLRQEVYTRLCEAAILERPALIKPFLFATARNLMIDRARRARIISIDVLADLEALNVPIDEPGPDREVSAREELRLLQRALNSLPERFREVLVLRKVEGLSQRETACRLGVSENSVEHHSGKGMQLLADALFGTEIGEIGRERVRISRKEQEEP
jgi:RNA polymerase sigma factor (sigma-70 family)